MTEHHNSTEDVTATSNNNESHEDDTPTVAYKADHQDETIVYLPSAGYNTREEATFMEYKNRRERLMLIARINLIVPLTFFIIVIIYIIVVIPMNCFSWISICDKNATN